VTDNVDTSEGVPGRLASIFDDFPPGTLLSFDDLELAMSSDLERRCLAALDRALIRLATPVLPTLPTPDTPDQLSLH
jgi:hypothetical protein